jgi:hypothetical protein
LSPERILILTPSASSKFRIFWAAPGSRIANVATKLDFKKYKMSIMLRKSILVAIVLVLALSWPCFSKNSHDSARSDAESDRTDFDRDIERDIFGLINETDPEIPILNEEFVPKFYVFLVTQWDWQRWNQPGISLKKKIIFAS